MIILLNKITSVQLNEDGGRGEYSNH